MLPVLFIVFAAALTAILEIQIEGSAGWAKNLPTWRPKPHRWYTKILRIFSPDPEPTGYHLAIWAVTFSFFHWPLFLGVPWSVQLEVNLLSAYMFFWVLEDFLWFFFNPAFGLRRFRPEFIPWRREWWGPFPRFYYVRVATIIVLQFLARVFS